MSSTIKSIPIINIYSTPSATANGKNNSNYSNSLNLIVQPHDININKNVIKNYDNIDEDVPKKFKKIKPLPSYEYFIRCPSINISDKISQKIEKFKKKYAQSNY